MVIFLLEHVKNVFRRKGDKKMKNMKKSFEALNVGLNCCINLCGNIAGGALLANAFW